MHRSDKETWGIYFTTDQQGERGENERVNETEMERGGKRKRARERKREVREGGGWNRGWRGVIPSCNLVFPRPFCPWAAVPPSSN